MTLPITPVVSITLTTLVTFFAPLTTPSSTGAPCLDAPGAAVDDSTEPPLLYTLEIDGKAHTVALDTPVTIAGDFKDPKVVLKASSTRRFNHGGVAFDYPAFFTWEASIEGPSEKTWTLSGNDFVIMVFEMPGPVSADEFSKGMAEQFHEGRTRLSTTDRLIGGRKREGQLLRVSIAGTELRLEIYALPSKTGSRLLVLQDSTGDDGAMSKEGAKAVALLSSSFTDAAPLAAPEADHGK